MCSKVFYIVNRGEYVLVQLWKSKFHNDVQQFIAVIVCNEALIKIKWEEKERFRPFKQIYFQVFMKISAIKENAKTYFNLYFWLIF